MLLSKWCRACIADTVEELRRPWALGARVMMARTLHTKLDASDERTSQNDSLWNPLILLTMAYFGAT